MLHGASADPRSTDECARWKRLQLSRPLRKERILGEAETDVEVLDNNCIACRVGAAGLLAGAARTGCPIAELCCTDGVDNDNDGAVDCQDLDCCDQSVCATEDACTNAGVFEIRSVAYVRTSDGRNRYYMAAMALVEPDPVSGAVNYCVQIDDHGIAGPFGNPFRFPPPHEYQFAPRDPCVSTLNPTYCQDWLGGLLAIATGGTVHANVIGPPTQAEAMATLAPITGWDFRARPLNLGAPPCNDLSGR